MDGRLSWSQYRGSRYGRVSGVWTVDTVSWITTDRIPKFLRLVLHARLCARAKQRKRRETGARNPPCFRCYKIIKCDPAVCTCEIRKQKTTRRKKSKGKKRKKKEKKQKKKKRKRKRRVEMQTKKKAKFSSRAV